jgi:hypothetical protein
MLFFELAWGSCLAAGRAAGGHVAGSGAAPERHPLGLLSIQGFPPHRLDRRRIQIRFGSEPFAERVLAKAGLARFSLRRSGF